MREPKKPNKTLSRKKRFENWWKRNHHSTQAHKWLAKNAKRVAYAMIANPTLFEDVKYITKRLQNSEYGRLNKEDAWKLWKAVHPSKQARVQAIIEAAEVYDDMLVKMQKHQLEKEGKTYYPPKKLKIQEQPR